MSKLLSTLLAAAAMLALSGPISAADQKSGDTQTQAVPNATQDKPSQQETDRMPQSQDQQKGSATAQNVPQNGAQSGTSSGTQSGTNDGAQAGTSNGAQSGTSQNQAGADMDMEAKDKQYSADLKKCGSMKGARKQKCMDSAEKKHGQM